MSDIISPLRMTVFVPAGLTTIASIAANRAGTFAHYNGMATPVVEAIVPVPSGHEVTLIERGDVKARAAAALEKA